MRFLAEQPLLMRCYNRLDVDRLHETATEKSLRDEIERSAKRARTRTSDRALPRFTAEHEGRAADRRGAAADHPVSAGAIEAVAAALDDYLATLAPHWRRALGGYTLVDIAHKVVGVGSVGLRAYVALLEGSSPTTWSSCSSSRPAGRCWPSTSTATRPGTPTRASGWSSTSRRCRPSATRCSAGPRSSGRQYYVRQFRNMKGTIPLDAIDAAALTDYAGIVGHLLAKGHARTSGASMIAGYVGGSDKLDRALAAFARAYADQTEADHAALVAAVRRGLLPVTEGALDRAGSAFRP